MADLNFMGPTKQNKVTFEVSALYNFFCSLSCINQDLDGLTGWIPKMKAEMPGKLLDDCRFYSHPALQMYDPTFNNMKDFLRYLESIEPGKIIERDLDSLEKKYRHYIEDEDFPSRDDLMTDRKLYREVLEKLYCCKGHDVEDDLIEKEFDKFGDIESYKRELINFIRTMWDYYFEEEWKREVSHVQSSAEAFASLDFGNKTTNDIVKQIIERDEIPDIIQESIDKGLEVIFIPSPHIGPYLLLISEDETMVRIMTKTRIPEGAVYRSIVMERSELLMQLNGLSDDTRLQILRMTSEEEAVTTQKVMDKLKLSQSSASRHLIQLTALGFLSARPEDRVKRYKINRNKTDSVFKLFNDFLKV